MDEVQKTTNWHELNISLKEDRYTIKEKLGEGNCCITYLAEDSKQKKKVAIKTLKETVLLEDNPQKIIDEFKNEVERLYDIHLKLKLTNKNDIFYNIVHYEDTFPIKVRFAEVTCLLMEYIDGKTLKKLVEEQVSKNDHKVLDETKALDYIRQVGKALIFFHENNLLHLDVNPNNIMIRNNTDKAVLIDFGTVRPCIPNYIQTVGFTHSYAPPEQCKKNNNNWGAFMDVYGLAATLYYLLTAKDPDDPSKRDKNGFLKELRNVSKNVYQAILKGMALQASERPQTVKEWLELLNKYDVNDLINSIEELEKAINTLFNPDELNYFLYSYYEKLYQELKKESKQNKLKTLISKLQGENDVKSLVDNIREFKPKYFT